MSRAYLVPKNLDHSGFSVKIYGPEPDKSKRTVCLKWGVLARAHVELLREVIVQLRELHPGLMAGVTLLIRSAVCGIKGD